MRLLTERAGCAYEQWVTHRYTRFANATITAATFFFLPS